MTLTAACVSSSLILSNEPLADDTSRPRTSAAIVAMTPVASFTVSLEASDRWWLGRRCLSKTPSSAPPNTHDEDDAGQYDRFHVFAGSRR